MSTRVCFRCVCVHVSGQPAVITLRGHFGQAWRSLNVRDIQLTVAIMPAEAAPSSPFTAGTVCLNVIRRGVRAESGPVFKQLVIKVKAAAVDRLVYRSA